MAIISWSAIQGAPSEFILRLKSCFSNPHLKRLWSFGAADGSDQDTSPLPPEPLPERRSIAELAIPAGICVALYGSISPDVQKDHGSLFLYYPLVAFICLGFFACVFAVLYALANRRGGGGAVESTQNRAMALSVGFLLVAFGLRILLLLSVTSMGLVGLVLLSLGAVAAAVLCILRLKVEERIAPAAAEAAQNHTFSVENQV